MTGRVAAAAAELTPAERRAADALLDDPKLVAFGTVAQLAARSGTSGPTVVRLASKLGFDGFVGLQAAVQEELADQLRPATERIREPPLPGDVVARVLAADLENVRASLEAVAPEDFQGAVGLLADRRRAVHVLAGELAAPLGLALVTQLDLLRPGVGAIGGSPVRTSRRLAAVGRGDVVVVIDHRRYERWVLGAAGRAAAAGAVLVAITDRRLSPLAAGARHTFVVRARGAGPFDSHAGGLSLVHALVAGVAARLRRAAVGRIDAVEAAWAAGRDLVED